MHKKIFAIVLGILFLAPTLRAGDEPRPVPPNEGMWLPHMVKAMNIDDMRSLGFRLTAEDIYSVNKASIKDAVVQLGGFCTAEVVSPEGLLFTNHHCAYDAIATHSTTENDYLTDGFWAKSKSEELNTPGLTVSFLNRIEDVTDQVLKAANAAGEGERDAAIGAAIEEIETKAGEGNDFKVQVKDVFHGNQFLLFVYDVFRDVRLVGAPPSSIGKFGGDTDNWMWPRHTGDFGVLRVYADKDNRPADYSVDNVPYKPKHFFPVSIKGIKNGDFAMTLGYPGSTERYLTSSAIKNTYDESNPTVIKILGERLEKMKEEMDKDDAVRIANASGYASLANYYKYCIGQNRGLARRGLIEERQAFEKKFNAWASATPDRKAKYASVLETISKNYKDSQDILRLRNYAGMAGFGPGFAQYGIPAWRLKRTMGEEEDKWMPMVERIKGGVDAHFEEYFPQIDQKVLASMMRMMYNDLPESSRPAIFKNKAFTKAKAKGSKDKFDAFAAKLFATSILVNKTRMNAFLAKPSKKVLEKDLGVAYAESIVMLYIERINVEGAMFDAADEEGMRVYQAGMMEMQKDKKFYPNANSTMRLSYGKVIPYDPRDGVSYKTQTYASGILEKEVPGDEEFDVPSKLSGLIRNKDFGRYGENGKMPTCFLTDNDITGGNSGSPVINGNGELIGIAFDGNWESMTSDLVFDQDIVRTISVDIRYVLFVIDKYAGASHLIKELEIR